MGIILCAFGLGLVIQGICYCRGQGSFSSKWWITILLVVMSLFFGVFIPGDYYESEEPVVIKIAGIQYLEIGDSSEARYITRNRYSNYTYIRQTVDEGGRIIWEPAQIPEDVPLIIVERPEYTEPILNIYERGYKRNFWTFSVDQMVHEYVFRLPLSDSLPIGEPSPNQEDLPQFEQEQDNG